MKELRLQLAQARADLRSAKDDYEAVRAACEQHAIDAGHADGKNAEERSRKLVLALNGDRHYLAARRQYRQAEAEVERLDALLEGARDARRYDEWTIRARLADALMGAGVQSDGEREAEFDDATDDRAVYAVERANGRYQPYEEETLPF